MVVLQAVNKGNVSASCSRGAPYGLTTHSARAEIAWMSFARSDASLNSSRGLIRALDGSRG